MRRIFFALGLALVIVLELASLNPASLATAQTVPTATAALDGIYPCYRAADPRCPVKPTVAATDPAGQPRATSPSPAATMTPAGYPVPATPQPTYTDSGYPLRAAQATAARRFVKILSGIKGWRQPQR